MLAVASGVGYGVLHGLGPDHCAAIAALSVRSAHPREATWIGIRFGVSHAAALTALALASAMLGVTIPERLEQTFELIGGALLFVLGALALRARGREVWVHRHGDVGEPSGWHVHLTGPERQAKGVGASWWGTAFAASGVRSLALVLSPMLLSSHSLASGLAFVVAFGVGVCGAMVVTGLLMAVLQRSLPIRPELRPLWLSRGVGVLSMSLALWWMWKSAALV
jgi:hypothetical protein